MASGLKSDWSGESGITAWFLGYDDDARDEDVDISFDSFLGEVNRVLFPEDRSGRESGRENREGGSSRMPASPPHGRGIAPKLNLSAQFPSAFEVDDEPEIAGQYTSTGSVVRGAKSMPRMPVNRNIHPVNTRELYEEDVAVPLSESVPSASDVSNYKKFHPHDRRSSSLSTTRAHVPPVSERENLIYQKRADSQALEHSMYDFGRDSNFNIGRGSRKSKRQQSTRRQLFNQLGM